MSAPTGCARPGGTGGHGSRPIVPTVPASPAVPSQSLTRSAALVTSTQIWPELGVNPASVLWNPEGVVLPSWREIRRRRRTNPSLRPTSPLWPGSSPDGVKGSECTLVTLNPLPRRPYPLGYPRLFLL